MTTRFISRTAAFVLILVLIMLTGCVLPNSTAPTPTPAETIVAGDSTGGSDTTGAGEVAAQTKGSPTLEAAGVRELSAADFPRGGDGMHGLILFTSSAKQPFADLLLGEPNLPYAEKQAWAVSPDGKRAGRVSPDGHGADLLTAAQTGGLPRLLEYGFVAGNGALETIPAPDACFAMEEPCGGFELSPDGRFLVFFSGTYADCGRMLNVLDLRSGEVTRRFPGAAWAYFTDNSTLMLASGTCEQQQAALYVPHNDNYAGTALGGAFLWNPARTAALLQSHQQTAKGAFAQPSLWGFHLETNKVFMWMNDPAVLEDSATWTPEGDAYLFNHRKVHYEMNSGTLVLEGPRQVLWMNAENRSQRRLAYDPGYDYHLCTGASQPCDEWYGEWVKVMRTPYKPISFRIDPATGQPEDRPAVTCALTGTDCAVPAEPFALNWKTGELVPWEDANLAEPTPALVNAPDQNAEPIYADPDANFTFYPGLDGHSLWYVPGDGEPELWVRDGEGFVYLP